MNKSEPVESNFAQASDFERANYWHIASKYLRYWYVFVLGLVLALGVAGMYLLRATPEYSITSQVLIKDRKNAPEMAKNSNFVDVSSLNYSDNIDNDVAALKSVSLMQRTLRELSMVASYKVQARFRDRELAQSALPFTLVFSALDSMAGGQQFKLYLTGNSGFTLENGGQRQAYAFGQPVVLPYARFKVLPAGRAAAGAIKEPILVTLLDVRETASNYVRNLTVAPVNKQASVLSLTLLDSVPENGEAILNKLIDVYNQENVEDNGSTAANTLEFITKRLTTLEGELSSVEKGVENFKHKYAVSDVGSQVNQSLAESSTYSKQIAEYDVQLEVLASIKRYVSTDSINGRLIPNALIGQDANLAELIARFNELQLNINRMLRTANESNPLVKNMLDLRSDLRSDILQNIRSTKNSLLISRRSLKEKSGEFGSRLQQVPTVERGLLEINRQQELKRALYVYLLQKKEEAGLTLAATISKTRVIDPALAGKVPVSPNKKSALLLALLLGLGLPVAFVHLKEALDDKVQLLRDVTWVTPASVLGELPHNATGSQLVIGQGSHGPAAEMLRLIRSNLHAALGSQESKVLLVTSGISGEGKSFFSLNLAASLVLAGKKTVLVQLDLRKRHPAWGTGKVGIADYLLHGGLSVDDIVAPAHSIPGLFVVDAGLMPADPGELMLSPKVGKLLSVLRQNFEYVLVDSAPVGQVADAFSLAPYLDSTIYLVRYNFTRKAQLGIVNKIVSDNKLGRIMLVLNDARRSNLHEYGYSYYERRAAV